MTARILVVDDIISNVKLMEAKLSAEYFHVTTAFNGMECLARMEEAIPDLVLLDVMMPGIDGFEVCRRIKANPRTAHVPVVIVTSLDQPSDRVFGLTSGADDFLTKPVDDAALFARVRSQVRLKMLTDELRLRAKSAGSDGAHDASKLLTANDQSGRILIVDDRAESVEWFRKALTPTHEVLPMDTFHEALMRVSDENADLVVVSLGMRSFDGLRLCSEIRASPEGRHLPILVVVSDGDRRKLMQALDMGVNDYLTRPVDKSELAARVRTQLRKKRYTDYLRAQIEGAMRNNAAASGDASEVESSSSSQNGVQSGSAATTAKSSANRDSDEWDVFISHASEDKSTVVHRLVPLLQDKGIRVWLDENELRLGDSLDTKINEGLRKSRFGVVILSKAFFAKDWPRRELEGLSALSAARRKVVLPVWHEVTHDDVLNYSPMLADKYASNTKNGFEVVATQIASIVFDASQKPGILN